MSLSLYGLIDPVEIKIVTPGNEERAEKVEKRTVSEMALRPISGRVYFDCGEITFTAVTPGGGMYEVENDAVIAAYLEHQFIDPKDPATRLAFDAMGMNDAMAVRQNLMDTMGAAAASAFEARQDAPLDRVRLIAPPTVHGEVVRDVPLRQPTHKALRRFGTPFFRGQLADGATQYMEKTEVIARYLDDCIEHDLGKALVPFLSLPDAMQIKMAVSGFFTRAALVAAGARKSRLSSSEPNTSPGERPTA